MKGNFNVKIDTTELTKDISKIKSTIMAAEQDLFYLRSELRVRENELSNINHINSREENQQN